MTAPLPTIGASVKYSLGRRWLFYGEVGIFRLEFDQYDGALNELILGFEHRTFEHVGFGMGFNYFEIDVDTDSISWRGEFDFEYYGPTPYVSGRFRVVLLPRTSGWISATSARKICAKRQRLSACARSAQLSRHESRAATAKVPAQLELPGTGPPKQTKTANRPGAFRSA